MKVIITEHQANSIIKEIDSLSIVKPYLKHKVKNSLGIDSDGGSDIESKFKDINIERDAPNLTKFLKSMKDGSFSNIDNKNVDNKNIKFSPTISKKNEMMHPLGGKKRITSNFGYRNGKIGSKNHKGVDFAIPSNSPIYSPMDGVVIKSTDTSPNPCGGHIKLDHGDIKTKYCHLSRMVVNKGDKVKKGQIIGYSGGGENDPHPGRSSGSHLHYEILNKNGIAMNPVTFQPNLS